MASLRHASAPNPASATASNSVIAIGFTKFPAVARLLFQRQDSESFRMPLLETPHSESPAGKTVVRPAGGLPRTAPAYAGAGTGSATVITAPRLDRKSTRL